MWSSLGLENGSIIYTLDLKNYPLMRDGTSDHQPFYFFEAFIKGGEFDESAMLEEAEELERAIDDNHSTITSALMVDKLDSNLNYQLYPNPANDEIIIDASTNLLNTSLSIVDARGVILLTFRTDRFPYNIDLTDIAGGCYTIRIGNVNLPFIHYR